MNPYQKAAHKAKAKFLAQLKAKHQPTAPKEHPHA